jgi:hypothetical protein
VREGAIFSRQALHSACVQADLRPRQIFAGVAIGGADTERDIMETAALGKVVADLVDLLLAPLGFDVLGC